LAETVNVVDFDSIVACHRDATAFFNSVGPTLRCTVAANHASRDGRTADPLRTTGQGR